MINLFSSSTAARNKWHQDMLSAHPSVSETRWWSVEEMDSYDLKHMYPSVDPDPIRGTITEWIRAQHNNGDMDGVHISYSYKTLCSETNGFDAQKSAHIKVELAASTDVSKTIRELTYFLEGNGPIALIANDVIGRTELELLLKWNSMDFTNTQRIIDEVVNAGIRPNDFDEIVPIKDAWVAFAKQCTLPGKQYFLEKVVDHPCKDIYKSTMLANP